MARHSESPFDTYLREIRGYALLGAEEERALGRRIQAASPDSPQWKRAGRKRANGPDPVLARMALEEDAADARRSLSLHNLRLVVSVAKRWLGRGLLLPDLVEEGNAGLWHAAELFDPTLGIRFSTYATWWIQQAVRRALVNTVRTVRVPRHMAQELARLRAWSRSFEQANGREPSPAEIEAHVKASPAKKRLLRRLLVHASPGGATVSLDALFEDDRLVPDPNALRPDRVDVTDDDRKRLRDAVARLPAREAEIVRRRYGLDGSEQDREPTLREIGVQLSLSRERVRQLERDAVRRLKGWLGAHDD
jgi:RNA polymerase sigma factor (sigma-70 family)